MKKQNEEILTENNKTKNLEEIYPMKTKTVKEIVLENQEKLKSFTTPKEFFNFAIEHFLDNKARFPHFKKALLKELNIDYAGLRNQKKAEFENNLKNQIKEEISLTTDAWGKKARYAVVLTETGKPISYGKFYQQYELEQSDAELDAAKYAIGIVAKLMKDNNIPAIKLNLTVDAQWLTYQSSYKQKGYELKELANAKKIFLNTTWQPGQDNLADRYSRAKDFQKTDYDLLKKSLKPVNWNDIDKNSNNEFEFKEDLNSDLKNEEKANQQISKIALSANEKNTKKSNKTLKMKCK